MAEPTTRFRVIPQATATTAVDTAAERLAAIASEEVVLKILGIIALLLIFVQIAQAQEPTTVPYGPVTITFDPSPDDRVVGYIMYFDVDGIEFNSDSSNDNTSGRWDLTGETPKFTLEEGRLYPGKTYTVTATAHDAYGNQSVKSDPLVVIVEAQDLPEENMMPLFEPVAGPQTITIQGEI